MSKYDDHIQAIKSNYPTSGYSALREALDCAVELMSDGAEAIGKTCKWQFSGNGWGDGHWYAECGLEWELGASGTLKEHGMNYCPRCGKRNRRQNNDQQCRISWPSGQGTRFKVYPIQERPWRDSTLLSIVISRTQTGISRLISHPARCGGRRPKVMADNLRKGSLISIAGHIQTGSYDKDGQRVYTTDVVVEKFHFLEAKK